ncbi:MAG: hypothetical protein IJ752_02180 [Alphaproteobacteria bacterium]|nr:hypothetical protein [Alphaproteobacteria bacterium]
MTQMQHIQTELNKANALLNAAIELINSGRIVSIASLSDIVNNICRLIKEEGYARCQAVEPLLIRLSDQMDQFRLVMENQLKNDDESPLY